MNYDISSNPALGAGSSSPLNDTCAPAGARFGSAVSAVNAWTNAGMPPNKIVLGVPAYGHSYVTLTQSMKTSNASSSNVSNSLSFYPPYNAAATAEHPGDKWDSNGGVDVCGVMQGPGGIYTYWGLVDEGFLQDDGSVADGIEFRFDDCSQTVSRFQSLSDSVLISILQPFLFNSTSAIYIAYENPRSYASKGAYIRSAGLKGFAMWEAGGDLNDTLLDSICTSAPHLQARTRRLNHLQ